jgi:hypothetical protein
VSKLVGIVITLLLFATTASSQVPTKGNVSFGYSYFNSDLSTYPRANLNGWNGSLEAKIFPFVGLVADVSGHYGSQRFPNLGWLTVATTVNVSEYNFLVGPRVSFSAGKIRPFAHAMFGFGHVNANAEGSDTSFATALGGGFDYRFFHVLGWRVQADYLQTRFSNPNFGKTRQDNLRLSTGIVLRF